MKSHDWLLALAAMLTLAFAAPSGLAGETGNSDAADIENGNCTTSKSRFQVFTGTSSTTANNYRHVPGSTVNFNQAKSGCVIVLFTAESKVTANTQIVLRSALDGNVVTGSPEGIFFASAETAQFGAHAMAFVFASVAAGDHSIHLEWFSNTPGLSVSFGYRTILVQHQ